MNDHMIRQDIVEVGRRMYNREFVASNDGNISVRIADNELLITPTCVSKGYMTTDDMLKVDLDGNVISGSKKPSSEIKMHLVIYKNRPDVFAVCHAHPQKATAFAVARQIFKEIALPEVIFSIGSIALSDYATPTTDELPKSIENLIKKNDAILLSNHGALTVGKDVFDAYNKMETLEHYAGIILYARQLGGEQGLTSKQIAELLRIRRETYGKTDLEFSDEGLCATKTAADPNKEQIELVREITMRVIEELRRSNAR